MSGGEFRENVQLDAEHFQWFDPVAGTLREPASDALAALQWAKGQPFRDHDLAEFNGCAISTAAFTTGLQAASAIALREPDSIMYDLIRELKIPGVISEPPKLSPFLPFEKFKERFKLAERFWLTVHPAEHQIHMLGGLRLPYRDRSTELANIRSYAVWDTYGMSENVDGYWLKMPMSLQQIYMSMQRYYQGQRSEGNWSNAYLRTFST